MTQFGADLVLLSVATFASSLRFDAVAVYTVFGLSYGAIAALVRMIVAPIVIVLTLRIPFKRTYHWMFVILSAVMFFGGLSAFVFSTSPNATIAHERVIGLFIDHTRFQMLVVFQFVVFFVARKVKLWQKLTIVGGYAYIAATVWLPLALGDTTFLYGNAVEGPLGWNTLGGTSDPYLRPYGIDIFTSLMGILTLGLLIRYYRSEKSSLVRGQTKYLMLGVVFMLAGFLSVGIARDLGASTLPNLQQELSAAGDATLLLGLRKKGFYSVTPVAESSEATAAPKFSLAEGRSYLADDPKNAFVAFTELVRSGRSGLCITRTFPDTVRKTYGLQTTPIRWLAEERRDDAIPPEDLTGLSLSVKDFIAKAERPVVMLHGVEYLSNINGFNSVLRLLNGLNDASAQRGGILILPVIPNSLEKQEQALLDSETTPLSSPSDSPDK